MPDVLQRYDWHGFPVELGDLFVVTKNATEYGQVATQPTEPGHLAIRQNGSQLQCAVVVPLS